MKNKKFLLTMFSVMMLMVLLTGCSSNKMCEEGDFIYKNQDSHIIIYGLSSTGKQKKKLLILRRLMILKSIPSVPAEVFSDAMLASSKALN